MPRRLAKSQARFRSSSALPFLTPTSATTCQRASAARLSHRSRTRLSRWPEALIAATGADFRIGSSRAYYNVTGDFVQVPPPAAYFEPINWHRTAFHELSHWSGAASRLGRDLSGSFGSKSYAREELVAEMAGAFVCASLGIVPTVRHADYIGSWLEVLREDNRAVVRAASAASKAADFLLGFLPHAIAADGEWNEEVA